MKTALQNLVAFAVVLTTTLALEAQGPVGPPTLEFSFSNPGARSVGFGGAFVALADDATAAYSNPSGLTQLLDPEVSLEGRTRTYRTEYTESGRASGAPTGIGIDTNPGLEFGESQDRTSGLSFASYVHPGGKWSAALYRHEYANFESTTRTQGIFGGDHCCENRYDDFVETTDLDIVSHGLAYAYRLRDDLSVGFGLIYYTGDLRLVTDIYAPNDDSIEAAFAPSSYLPERRSVLVDTRGEAGSLGMSAGFLWKTGRFQFGGAFRQGPSLETVLLGTAGPAYQSDVPTGTILGRLSLDLQFPDVISLGGSFRSDDGRLTVGFEWDRVGYAAYIRSIDNPGLDTSDMYIDDANELHLGAEFVFLSSKPLLAVRGGLWLDPEHRVRYDGDDPLTRAILQRGEDELHYAVGLGLVLGRIQIDVGIDLSDRVDTASVSAIYSF